MLASDPILMKPCGLIEKKTPFILLMYVHFRIHISLNSQCVYSSLIDKYVDLGFVASHQGVIIVLSLIFNEQNNLEQYLSRRN